MVTESEVIDPYAREYARLECESTQMKSGQPNGDAAVKRMKSLQRKLLRRECERFVTEQQGAPAVKRGIKATRLHLLTRKGIDIAKRFLLFILAWVVAFRGTDARQEKKKNAMRFK